MTVDVSCCHCGREPSHPQVRHRFIYAAYYQAERAYVPGPRCYIAALCESCYEPDRRAGTGTARARFFRHVGRWSGQPGNRERVVRLLEHPESITGNEWEADNCFHAGVAVPFSSLDTAEGTA